MAKSGFRLGLFFLLRCLVVVYVFFQFFFKLPLSSSEAIKKKAKGNSAL